MLFHNPPTVSGKKCIFTHNIRTSIPFQLLPHIFHELAGGFSVQSLSHLFTHAINRELSALTHPTGLKSDLAPNVSIIKDSRCHIWHAVLAERFLASSCQ